MTAHVQKIFLTSWSAVIITIIMSLGMYGYGCNTIVQKRCKIHSVHWLGDWGTVGRMHMESIISLATVVSLPSVIVSTSTFIHSHNFKKISLCPVISMSSSSKKSIPVPLRSLPTRAIDLTSWNEWKCFGVQTSKKVLATPQAAIKVYKIQFTGTQIYCKAVTECITMH